MPHPTAPLQADRVAGSALRRVLLGICAIVLALQLIGSAFHQHDAADIVPDCVSCQIAGQLLADVPGAPATVLAVLLVVAYLLALRPVLPDVVVLRYLIPARQAPPRA